MDEFWSAVRRGVRGPITPVSPCEEIASAQLEYLTPVEPFSQGELQRDGFLVTPPVSIAIASGFGSDHDTPPGSIVIPSPCGLGYGPPPTPDPVGLLHQGVGPLSGGRAERTVTTTSGRRRAQNRAAQRAFRERKERHARDLEVQLASLTEKYTKIETSHTKLNASYDKLRKTVELLTQDDDAEGDDGRNNVIGRVNNSDTVRRLLEILHGEFEEIQPEDSRSQECGDLDWWSEGSSPRSETQEPPVRLYPLVEKATAMIFAAFSVWRRYGGERDRGSPSESRNGNDSDESQRQILGPNTLNFLGNSSSMSRSSGLQHRKRRSGDDGDDDRPVQRRGFSTSPETRLLACPFAKHNPWKHRKCFKYTMGEIARLKQHLSRVHQVPIHCTRYSQTFQTEVDRDDHLRRIIVCETQPARNWDGISESQKRQLGKRVSPKKTKEENWYLIYGVLFPNSRRPDSPYIENIHLSEELLALREFTMREAPTMITAFAQLEIPAELRESQVQVETFTQAAVRNVFDMVIERWMNEEQSCEASTILESGYVSGVSSGFQIHSGSSPSSHIISDPMPSDHSLVHEGAPFTTDAMALPVGSLTAEIPDAVDTLDWLSLDATEFGFYDRNGTIDLAQDIEVDGHTLM